MITFGLRSKWTHMLDNLIRTIMERWIKNEMTGSTSMKTPALSRIMIWGTAVCRQVTEKEYQLCLYNFVPLLNLIYLHGHVLSDKEFLPGGFPAANTN